MNLENLRVHVFNHYVIVFLFLGGKKFHLMPESQIHLILLYYVVTIFILIALLWKLK